MTTAGRNRVRFNPFDAAFRRDPYPVYRRLRETAPVHRTLGMWVLTRYDDARAVLADRSFSAGLIPRLVAEQAVRLGRPAPERIGRLGRASLVFTDNPDHARLRGLVNRVFTAGAVAELRPLVAAASRRILDDTDPAEVDLIAEYAAPLPVSVLCDWMALPGELRGVVGAWTHDIRFLLDPGLMRAGDLDRVRTVVELFTDALAEVFDARRAAPGDDLLSRLLAARTAGGERLTDEELAFLCIMCFVAGTETSTCLIGNAALALLRHPDRAAAIRADPTRARAAVTETLRYDAPLQLTKRQATRDVALAGHTVRAGDQVLICLGAANRDPAAFDHPDEFDPTRSGPAHLAFGHGMHGCLGGALAELQAEIAVAELFGPGRRPAAAFDEVDWQEHSSLLRGPRALPVRR
ncbi:cytochrome P450 [Nocardia thailandica]